MKNKKTIPSVFALLMLLVCFTASNTFAQNKSNMKDGCMMKDGKMMMNGCMMSGGKMMCMKDGKTMPMEHDMTMMNGTMCKTNGDYIMKDGTKMKMKESECMDMNGKMDKCSMMNKDVKSSTEKQSEKKEMKMTYTCPMHPDVISDKAGQCPKCGMDLVEKK
ncbi:MAG: DUF6799 domain-containing protein [Bacteroidia bacterium]